MAPSELLTSTPSQRSGSAPNPLPELPGYETGLIYAPAGGDPAGGDVYGAWPVRGADMAVLVGDVAGKGLERAGLSAMVRSFVEACSSELRSPAAILEEANIMLLEQLPDDTFVTAFLAILSAERMRYCVAGHPPPLHVSGASVGNLAGRGLALGVEANPDYVESRLRLEHGDLILAYTDGLTDARRDGETFGAVRLARLVGDSPGTLAPEQLVRSVHDEVAAWAGGLADDAMALAWRRKAPADRSA